MNEEKIMSEEENVNTLTLANYFGGIKRFKWWVLGATVLSTLAGYLFVRFGLNRSKEQLASDFSYNINLRVETNNDSELAYSELTHYLADNSIYNYSDIISEQRLKDVKALKDEYKNINVDSMLQSNAIRIEKEGHVDSNGKMVYTYPERYTLTVSASFFKDTNQGKSFIKDLVEYELDVASKANNSYEVPYYINDSFSSLTLNNRIELLDKQYAAINSVYSVLNGEFAESSMVDENVSLRTRYNNFIQRNTVGAFTKYENLKNEYRLNHYVDPNYDTVEKLIYRAEEYKSRIKDDLIKIGVDDKALEKLVQTTTITTVEDNNILNDKIVELTEEMNLLKLDIYNCANELKNLGYIVPDDSSTITLSNLSLIVEDTSLTAEGSIQYLKGSATKPANWDAACSAFTGKVNDSVQTLKEDVDDCTEAYHNLYNTYKNKANFYTTNFAVVQNHTNVVYGIVIGLVAGFVLSSIAVMIVHINKPVAKKEK